MTLLGMPIMKSQWVMMLLGTSIMMSQWVSMCTYHGITVHNDVAMNIFYYFLLCILWSMPNCVILLWVVWNKNKNKWVFDQSELENTLMKYPYTKTTYVFSADWSNTHLFLLYRILEKSFFYNIRHIDQCFSLQCEIFLHNIGCVSHE